MNAWVCRSNLYLRERVLYQVCDLELNLHLFSLRVNLLLRSTDLVILLLYRIVSQVSFRNIGPVDNQHPPGVNMTAVGVDVFVEDAPMACYKDISTSYAAHVRIQFL